MVALSSVHGESSGVGSQRTGLIRLVQPCSVSLDSFPLISCLPGAWAETKFPRSINMHITGSWKWRKEARSLH